MRYLFRFVILIMFVLVGCSEKESPVEDTESNTLPSPEIEKEIEDEVFYPLMVDYNLFIEVIDWYDDQSILYLTDENGKSYLKRYHFVTKEEEELFSIDEPIMSVTANIGRSLFAVQTAAYTGGSPLYIIDRQGSLLYSSADLGEGFSLFWNPYDEEQLLIVSFLPNWKYEVYLLSIDEAELKSVDIQQTFFQWLDQKELAYFDWSEDEPSYQAPLLSLRLDTGEEKQLFEQVIGMFSFANHIFFTVTVETKYDLLSTYTFYKNLQKISEFQVPILNTYSEHWWIPFYDYDYENEYFYYLSPYDSADFFEYEDGFELTAFNINTGEKTAILKLENHAPIKLSPNGKHLLYGNQLEQLIDLKTKKRISIVDYR